MHPFEERQFEYRGWDEQAKIMHYDFKFIQSGQEGNDWILFQSDKLPPTTLDPKKGDLIHGILFNNPFFRQQLKVTEWIGIKDMEDRKIFHGDFLIHERSPLDWQMVRFSNGAYYCGQILVNSHHPSVIKIVGNIFENPEMIR